MSLIRICSLILLGISARMSNVDDYRDEFDDANGDMVHDGTGMHGVNGRIVPTCEVICITDPIPRICSYVRIKYFSYCYFF